MNINSERLQLRFISNEDIVVIHELHSFPEIDQYNALGIPKSLEETRSVVIPWIEENLKENPKGYTFHIQEGKSKNFIGLFGLKLWPSKHSRAEVWYKLHPNSWGKGYATEALQAILDICFNELGLHRVQAGCAVNNIASIKVLEKAGMIREGRGRQILPLASGWSDNFEYSILETDKRTN